VFIVIAVFAYIIATLFVRYPGTVIPINFQIIIALFIGWWAYQKKKGLLIPSIIALLLLYVMIYVGFRYPIHLPEWLWLNGSEVMTWIIFLMAYGFIAAVLPVWALLQPRDYINSHQLIVGLGCIYLGIFVSQPIMDAPPLALTENPIPWFPFLFVFIACGAISGFHSLVSSGTTAKQLAHIRDSRVIGYGGMMGEACLAVAATIAVAAGFKNSGAWHAHYGNFEMAKGLGPKLSAFVDGTSGFLNELGITQTLTDSTGETSQLAAVFIGVMVISFAATSLDTAVRIQRYIIGEIGEALHSTSLAKNRYLQSGIAVTCSMVLILSDGSGTGGLRLWPLFGSTNQLLGSLVLLVISVWLYHKKRNYWIALIPMVFITAVTFIATFYNFISYLKDGQWMLVIIATVIGICQLWIIFEGIKAFGHKQVRVT
jgi:carbon starvation protein